MRGCKDVCEAGTSPNFCDGAPALTQCATCLAITCSTALCPL
ncbi:hypothetical protein A7982_13971 [Minicystis rosea]|nr:hypothetical protein A7982_13971 [Minicystis rosea]